MFISKCPLCYHETEREDLLKGKMLECPKCGDSYGMDKKQFSNLQKIMNSTSNIIVAVKLIGWLLGITCIISALSMLDTDNRVFIIPLLIFGIINIIGGVSFGCIIDMFKELIKIQYETLNYIKELKDK